MTGNGVLQICVYLAVLVLLVKPLGSYMATIYAGPQAGKLNWAQKLLGPFERLIYKLCGIDAEASNGWGTYATGLSLFNLMGGLLCYGLLRVQPFLPWNPQNFPALDPHTAFNIAASFITNTNWQNYGGETTLGYFVQMVTLTVQNFVSAASGMAVLVALARGLSQRSTKTIGNFWVDMVRSTIYVLLPLSVVLTVLLVSQGVIQNLKPYQTTTLVQATKDANNKPVTEQLIPMGPAASQIAIKQLGTNGGGFFNANSAHPFENPTPFSNFLQLLSILLIPAALCYTFGKMIKDTRQGWAILAAMLIIFVPLLFIAYQAEASGITWFAKVGVPGGNLEGKDLRFGVTNSALWAAATTAASNGSVNSMHDSFTPIGGMVPMFLIKLGEVVFGGVGSGLYGMILFAIVAVFLAGLMVGRTPEYLGKKIEAFEMKMASIAILVPPFCVLFGTAIGVSTAAGLSGLANHGPHGFSEILYAFTSMGNNNGSAFGGYSANNPLVNFVGGVSMLLSRYWIALPVLAIAGSVGDKKLVPAGAGTLPTHTPLFVLMLVGTVIIVGALAFIPVLALGPIIEHLRMVAG